LAQQKHAKPVSRTAIKRSPKMHNAPTLFPCPQRASFCPKKKIKVYATKSLEQANDCKQKRIHTMPPKPLATIWENTSRRMVHSPMHCEQLFPRQLPKG